MSDKPETHLLNAPLTLQAKIYDRLVLANPLVAIILVLGLGVFFLWHAKSFKMDASSDSIVLENDDDMRFYTEMTETYGADEFVAVTVTPEGDLFGAETIEKVKALIADLSAIEGILSVTSFLNVPLFHSPDIPLLKLADGYNTLSMPETPVDMAKKEILESPLFSNFLISPDGSTTILQVNFKPDPEMNSLYFERFNLREKRKAGTLSPEESKQLEKVSKEYKDQYEARQELRRSQIDTIRDLMKTHAGVGELHLGGVPMVIADIVNYVERDILVFGLAVIVFIFFMMGMIFRRWNFMILTFFTCLLAVFYMVGYLGLVDWHTTIVTSNFTSLLLIITTENAIHVATQYREFRAAHPDVSNREAVLAIVRSTSMPCFFATFTTCVGFFSLIVSGIPPIMDFGKMMTYGLAVSYAICFIFMPAGLMLIPIKDASKLVTNANDTDANVTIFAHLTDKHARTVIIVTVIVFIIGAIGTQRLTVENRFFDYFRSSTPLHQGFVEIDERMGGTTPLDIIIRGDGPDYFANLDNLAKIKTLHEWLDAQPEIGKVVSVDTMMRLLEGINKKPITPMIFSMVKSRLPEEIAKNVLSPYVNADFSEIRVSTRALETYEGMDRSAVIDRINKYMQEEMGLKQNDKGAMESGQYRVTGMFVLYNNMLQTLFTSQIKTVGTVLITCLLTFWLVFRNFRLALIGLVPNILAVTVILGMIAWLRIPMDMMTIMIAAITFGLADDNTIHYIHRFKHEFPKDHNYRATMYRCHNSVGRALSYSMVTIVVGFAILTLSNFMPTVYFGLFTGVAIFLALLASHTILPLMIIYFKPLGKDSGSDSEAPNP